MLEPDDRRLLLDALRPPPGFRVDQAVGTTYTLDLVSLLVAPLAFALFEADDPGRAEGADGGTGLAPLALLTALRRYAGRTTVFCQAGRIAVPKRHQRLFAYLEAAVHEAAAPTPGRAFHPKIWLLRFEGPDGEVVYRFLCASRNLTFDRSWDTLLVLEGPLTDRTRAFQINHPLGDFVAALPALSRRTLTHERSEAITRMADEVRRVKFEAPAGLTLAAFHPLGLTYRRAWPFDGRRDRMLVVAPFLTPGFLADITAETAGSVLVSRADSLLPLGRADLAGFARVCQMNPAAEPEDPPDDGPAAGPPPLAGLHAKLFAADAGWDARLWTGSANATEAAFTGNVEFLVELTGKKKDIGVDALLDPAGLGGLLQDVPADREPLPADPDEQAVETVLEDARCAMTEAGLRAVYTPAGDGGLRLDVWGGPTPVMWPGGVSGTCRPISLPAHRAAALAVGAAVVATFEAVPPEDVTGFVAFDLAARVGAVTRAATFVLNLPLDGCPADRDERLLRALLQNRGQVLRLLRFLLAGADPAALAALDVGGPPDGGIGSGGSRTAEEPVFEMLLRALDRDPARLDEVDRLYRELGQGLFPERFSEIWGPIWAARERLRP